jgi:hypothetical protein
LAGALVSLVPSPVAVARHLRSTLGGRLRSLSFAGGCPGAAPPEYEMSYEPRELFAMFRERGVEIQDYPDVYVDRVPPDRRRHLSLPGGCPAADVLWQRCNERTLIELEGGDLPVEIAQHLLSARSLLIDPAPGFGCACAGVTHSTAGTSARLAVTSLEPTRSATPIFESTPRDDLVLEIPASPYVPQAERDEYSDLPPMAVTPLGALPSRLKGSA